MGYTLLNIKMTLDPGSVANALREIQLFESRLKPAMDCLITYLAEKGVEIARAELIFFDDPAYQTGALSESVTYHIENGDGVVTAGEGLMDGYGTGSYAIYVEYGTGIFGADINNHGLNGWWYPAPWGWWTPATGKHAGEKMAWTLGMPPRPFMQNTLHDLEDEARVNGGKIIAEYLRGERA